MIVWATGVPLGCNNQQLLLKFLSSQFSHKQLVLVTTPVSTGVYFLPEKVYLFGMVKKKERLIAVSPSGKKEGSLADLIHDVVRQIPRGRVTTYGAIAKVLDLPNPRMVGRAMHTADDKKNPIPFQRVINSSGRLSGEYTEWRKKLLEKEGVKINGVRIVDFKTLFWDPAKEL